MHSHVVDQTSRAKSTFSHLSRFMSKSTQSGVPWRFNLLLLSRYWLLDYWGVAKVILPVYIICGRRTLTSRLNNWLGWIGFRLAIVNGPAWILIFQGISIYPWIRITPIWVIFMLGRGNVSLISHRAKIFLRDWTSVDWILVSGWDQSSAIWVRDLTLNSFSWALIILAILASHSKRAFVAWFQVPGYVLP